MAIALLTRDDTKDKQRLKMDTQNKADGSSRRKFIKIAVATAYVAPLIASMPAQAALYGSGSKQVTRKVWKQSQRRFSKFSKFRKYRKYGNR